MHQKLQKKSGFFIMLFYAILIIAAVSAAAQAQVINVSGTVSTTTSTVRGAAVTFINNSDTTLQYSATTNVNGVYQISIATSVESPSHVPGQFKLQQNHPNPFSSSTAISYQLNRQSDVALTIYDIRGRKVKQYNLGIQPNGTHQVVWNGVNSIGEPLASGVYFYRLKANDQVQVKKMLYYPGKHLTGARMGMIPGPSIIPARLQKGHQVQASEYSVRIENTGSASPEIIPARVSPVPIESDTTLNFEVKESLDDAVLINPDSTHQIIRGFGAANIVGWRPDMTEDQVDLAFGTGEGHLGFTMLRLRIPPNPNDFSRQVRSAKRAYNQGAVIIAAPWTPPADMKTNNSLIGGRLKESAYDDYADHLASFADYMQDNGVPIHAISVQNEPDVDVEYESCDWNAAEMLKFMQENAPAVGTKVMAPESFHFDHDLSDPLLNDPTALANLGMVAGHIYGGGLEPYPLARSKGVELWMTEHLDTDTSWGHVLATGKEINDCMNAGMSAYLWWYIVRFYGPIDEDGRISKRGYVMSQFSRFIRPGYFRAEASARPQRWIETSAYTGNGKLVIVAVNRSSSPVDQTFVVENGTTTRFTPTITSYSKDCRQEQDITATDGMFRVSLDASSVTTFVSQ
ncbi:MAG: FlgD immunoglobulin-like domain containing protein [candidate division KSB1 bacterium]|nr:FlgD immunoglobulin-like domain containing protein [candidate division KSB1 bacterium]